MKELEESFRRKGLLYTHFKRNEYVALYGIKGEFTDKYIAYEVDIIYVRDDKYGKREHIAANSDFGRDRSRCYNNERKVLEYHDELTARVRKEGNLSKWVVKAIEGVGQNMKVILEYHTG